MRDHPAGWNPYVGPRPFELADQEIFFGRSREIREIYSLVVANSVLLIHASSGAGKTSLINAGLQPRLKRRFETLPMGRLRSTSASRTPASPSGNAYVFNALSDYLAGEPSPGSTLPDQGLVGAGVAVGSLVGSGIGSLAVPAAGAIVGAGVGALVRRIAGGAAGTSARTRPAGSLVDFLALRPRPVDRAGNPLPRVLIFDQLEEIFSAPYKPWLQHREDFFHQVGNVLAKDDLLRVIFAIREDYLGQLERYATFLPGRLQYRFRLDPLSEAEAIDAIVQPVNQTSRKFADGVAERLVDDLLQVRVDTGAPEPEMATGEFVDPVQLQVVCHNLWSQLPAAAVEISQDHLREYGNVDHALRRFYDEAIGAAAAKAKTHEGDLRQRVESVFITKGRTRSFVYWTPKETAGILQEAIDELERRHLIKAEIRAGARWFELNHDRLIGPIIESNKTFAERSATQGLLARVGQRTSRRRPDTDTYRAANQALAEANEAERASEYDRALSLVARVRGLYENAGDQAGVASALLKEASIRLSMGDHDQALALLDRSLGIYRRLNDLPGQAGALGAIGLVRYQQEDYDHALQALQQQLDLAVRLSDPPAQAIAWMNTAAVFFRTGQLPSAMSSLERSLQIHRELADRHGQALVLDRMASVQEGLGDIRRAITLAEEAAAIFRQLDEIAQAAGTLAEVGRLAYALHDFRRAIDALEQARLLNHDLGDRQAEAQTLMALAEARAAVGETEEASGLNERPNRPSRS